MDLFTGKEPFPVRYDEPMDVTQGPYIEDTLAPEQRPTAARPPQQGPCDVPPAPLSEPCAVIPLFPPEESAPRFTMPLRNLSTNDGDRAVFRVFFSGYPNPQITWFFNSQPIRPSADFQISIDIQRGESSLVIVEVYPEDEGEYMCKAVNPLGTAVTHCHLFVKCKSLSYSGVYIHFMIHLFTLEYTCTSTLSLSHSHLSMNPL